jgi:ribosomal protein S21|tara:strand:+ start:636 stop:872 length:237 start_codon:yes stop_codon:yes gene_type:complete
MSKKHKYHQSIIPGSPLGVAVMYGDLGFALRLFKKKLKDSDVLKNFKERKEFIKPSVKKRKQLSDAIFWQKVLDSREQ